MAQPELTPSERQALQFYEQTAATHTEGFAPFDLDPEELVWSWGEPGTQAHAPHPYFHQRFALRGPKKPKSGTPPPHRDDTERYGRDSTGAIVVIHSQGFFERHLWRIASDPPKGQVVCEYRHSKAGLWRRVVHVDGRLRLVSVGATDIAGRVTGFTTCENVSDDVARQVYAFAHETFVWRHDRLRQISYDYRPPSSGGRLPAFRERIVVSYTPAGRPKLEDDPWNPKPQSEQSVEDVARAIDDYVADLTTAIIDAVTALKLDEPIWNVTIGYLVNSKKELHPWLSIATESDRERLFPSDKPHRPRRNWWPADDFTKNDVRIGRHLQPRATEISAQLRAHPYSDLPEPRHILIRVADQVAAALPKLPPDALVFAVDVDGRDLQKNADDGYTERVVQLLGDLNVIDDQNDPSV